jgi:antitoxin component YwqK of YwqJK toxin-antitoxin module
MNNLYSKLAFVFFFISCAFNLFSQIQTSEIKYIEENCTAARNLYFDDNPDVKKNGVSAWSHYENFGKREGRKWPRCLTSHSVDLNTLEEFYKKNKDSVYKIQINNYQPNKVDSLFMLDSKNFNGFYYSYYDNKQIKAIQEIKDGRINGKTVDFWFDKSYNPNIFKDTALLNSYNSILQKAKNDLALCLLDTAKYCKDERDFLKNEIGGYEKLQKIISKYDEDKLNDKRKAEFEHYISLTKNVNSSQEKLYLINKTISELKRKINDESSKKVFTPIKSTEYYMIDTLKEGNAIIYNSSGAKIEEGNYKNNFKYGLWKYYSKESKLIEEAEYENGKLNGIRKNYNSFYTRDGYNGNLFAEAHYKNGELNGLKKEFYKFEGTLQSANEYLNDKKTGVSIYYNVQGKKISEVTYKDDKKQGKEFLYDDNGILNSEYIYVLDEKEGPFKVYYHSNGKVKREGNYSRNMLNGIVKEYYNNGSIMNEGNYSNNRKNGPYKEYFENGKLKLDANYLNDKRNGKHKTFYETGQIESEISWANDKLHGPEIRYYYNGKVNRKTTIDTNSLAFAYGYPFNDEHVIGDYYKYNEDGTLSNHYFAYKDGRLDIKFPKPEPVIISSAKTAPNPQVSNANNGPKWECTWCHELSYKESQSRIDFGCTDKHGTQHFWDEVQSQSVLGKCKRCGVITYRNPVVSEGCGNTGFIHDWEKY